VQNYIGVTLLLVLCCHYLLLTLLTMTHSVGIVSSFQFSPLNLGNLCIAINDP